MADDQFDDNPFRQRGVAAQEGFADRRGKQPFGKPRACWGMKGGMGQDVDHDAARKVLDEALR